MGNDDGRGPGLIDIGAGSELTPTQTQVVALLEKALAQAQRGEFDGAGLVMVKNNGDAIQVQQAGVGPSAIYFGAGQLMDQLREQIFPKPEVKKPESAVVQMRGPGLIGIPGKLS